MSYSTSALIMLAAGLGIPVLAALNAALGQFLGSPVAAVTVLLCVACSAIFIILLTTSSLSFARLAVAPRHLFLPGLLVTFYILSIPAIAPHFGVGNAVFFVLLGQLISAAVVDHFALFGASGSPLSLTRSLGLGVMALGVWITQQA